MGRLDEIHAPSDLKRVPRHELAAVADELRDEIVRVCSGVGGHLASSLGAVELTVALHYLFDSERDRFVWDVGHQSYGHKILTGRRDRMHTIRAHGGLAGFTTTSESPHDALTVGHASTSLAASLGMALARDARGDDYRVTAIIGDGALTGGMALAALNQIGHVRPKMTVILNDNEMSISENVGALNHYMRHMQVKPWLQRAERDGKRALSGGVLEPLARLGSGAKAATRRFFDPASDNPFHAMGLRYVGPIDGHDVDEVLYFLEHIDALDGPTMLHIVTRKGKGYSVAESDPITWHGASKFDPANPVAKGKPYGWSNAFGDAAIQLADADDRVWVLTPAMREGSGLVSYSKHHPERYLDVGIAEDVAVTTAAGLALQGEKPIVAIYSTFLQRGFDQVVHDVSIENLDVVFAIDRAGLVGGDGATHQGVYDLAYLRAIPNLEIAMPRDAVQQRAMVKAALDMGGPKAIRWPRGSVDAPPEADVDAWPDVAWGQAEVLKPGTDVWVWALGPTVAYALEAAGDDPRIGVVDARFVKPLDRTLLARHAQEASHVVTIEDHNLPGGFGSAVSEAFTDDALPARLTRLGVPDVVVPHGDPKRQHDELGYGPESLRATLARLLGDAAPEANDDAEEAATSSGSERRAAVATAAGDAAAKTT